MSKVSLSKAAEQLEALTEQERRALRGSRFASLQQQSSSSTEQNRRRFPHPGGPVTTNKAAALAKFLERKIEQPGGLDSLDPDLVELAIENAKKAASGGSSSGCVRVKHVRSFSDPELDSEGENSTTKKKAYKPKRQTKPGNQSSKVSVAAKPSFKGAQKCHHGKRKLKK